MIGSIISIVIAESAGFIGSVFTTPNIAPWYEHLNRPTWGPPNWLFGPVWITLYALMGVAAYLVYRKIKTEKSAKDALGIYIIQLSVNVAWSAVFFGARNIGAAFAVILLLLSLIILTIIYFQRYSKMAGWLLLPYLLWVSFATILNFAIWRLN